MLVQRYLLRPLLQMLMLRLGLLLFWCWACVNADPVRIPVSITVNAAEALAESSADFVCVNMDWWPPEKCDYGKCAWGNASILRYAPSIPGFSLPTHSYALMRMSSPPMRSLVGGPLPRPTSTAAFKVAVIHHFSPPSFEINERLQPTKAVCLP